MFIDSALKELLSYTGDEKSTLFIANVGLTQNDIDTIASYSDFYGFRVKYFTDTCELNEYINNGDDFNRADDPITKFRVFSHGYVGSIEFGHGVGLSAIDKGKLSWTINKINQLDPNNKINYLDPNAFKKTNSIFYSCNTGTTTNGTSFAQEWSNITGGKTKAVVPNGGQTNAQTKYTGINSPVWWRFKSYLTHKFLRNIAGGYSVPYPSFSLPTPANNAKWKTFKPQ